MKTKLKTKLTWVGRYLSIFALCFGFAGSFPALAADSTAHQAILTQIRAGGFETVFFGDSNTEGWRRSGGKTIWSQELAPLKAANFGVCLDTAAGLLWRLQNGELDGYQAKSIVVLIGGFEILNKAILATPADTAAQVAACLQEIRTRQPQAKIFLCSVPYVPIAKTDTLVPKLVDFNNRCAALADGQTIIYVDMWADFQSHASILAAELLAAGGNPYLLPTYYRLWADHIVPLLQSGGNEPVNKAPVANAGVDQTITLPANNTVTLAGTASDDGLPGGSLTTTWTLVSGPVGVMLDNVYTANTTAHFTVAGTYLLRLTVDDGELASIDEVTVVVNAESSAPPAVPAAPDGLVATAVSTSQINLTWRDNSNTETAFIVERLGTDGFVPLATLGPDVTSFANSALALAGKVYAYRVKAVNSNGASGYSNTSFAVTFTSSEPVITLPGDFAPFCMSAQSHQYYLTKIKTGGFEIPFFGGSFTYGWDRNKVSPKPTLWNQYFVPLKAATFGLPGEPSWGCLWRLRNGELDGYQAKVVVLDTGGNDIRSGGATVGIMTASIKLCIEEIRKRQPQAKILVIPLMDLPEMTAIIKPENTANGQYAILGPVNQAVAALADNRQVYFLHSFQEGLRSRIGEICAEMEVIMSPTGSHDPHDCKVMYEVGAATFSEALIDILAGSPTVRGTTPAPGQ